MVPENEMCQLANYAASSQYKESPSPEQIACGVIPLDSLPASWWNWFWSENNKATNCARTYLTSLITELNNVLDAAGVCPQAACMDQLKQSIRILSRRIATATEAGAVVSDTGCGNVSVNATTGVMTANGLGNVTNLTTSVKTDMVAALNNVWGNFSACASSWNTCLTSLQNNKAPNNHATNALTYGGGTSVNYGHVKLSDTYSSCVGAASESVAASQKALADAYAAITSAGYVVLGNTTGCALGTASAGSATTAARSDHVHPNTNLWCLDSNDIYPGLSMGCCGSGGNEADYTQWVRSPLCGFIPYCANETSGFGCVGTISYPFKEMWAKCFVGNLTGVALCSSYLTSPSAAGIVTDDYGNIRPRTADNTYNWNISNASCTSFPLKVYFESGTIETTGQICHKGPVVIDYSSSISGNWNEGLRINSSTGAGSGWSTFVMGGAPGSCQGCTGAFSMHTWSCLPGKLFFAYQGSETLSYFEPVCDAYGSVKWHGDVVGNAETATQATCAWSTIATYDFNNCNKQPNQMGVYAFKGFMSNQCGLPAWSNWYYMDAYAADDAGGATALVINRCEPQAWIFSSTAARTSWTDSAEIITTRNIAYQAVAASNTLHLTGSNANSCWHWDGLYSGGTPPWVWGGTDGLNMYVYNPACFTVRCAETAINAVYASSAYCATKMVGNYYMTCACKGAQGANTGEDFHLTIAPLERVQGTDNYIYCNICLSKYAGSTGCIYINNNSGMVLYYNVYDTICRREYRGMVPVGAQNCCIGEITRLTSTATGDLIIGPYSSLACSEVLISTVGPYMWVPSIPYRP